MPLNLVKQRVYYIINCHLVKRYQRDNMERFQLRNETLKNKLATLYIQQVKDILHNKLHYDDDTAKDLAQDIVKYGYHIYVNICFKTQEENDEHDDFIEEVNQLGNEFQAMKESTTLVLDLESSDADVCVELVEYQYPLTPRHITKCVIYNEEQLAREIKFYLKYRAFLGSAASIIVCAQDDDHHDDSGKTIEFIEKYICDILKGKEDDRNPMVVDLIRPTRTGIIIKSITPGDEYQHNTWNKI